MLATIGLTLDIVAAILVLLGLFRSPSLLYPGWSRSPAEAAEDRAYGVTGGLYFVLGFVGQILGNAGVGVPVKVVGDLIPPFIAALVIGSLLAYLLFGLSVICWMKSEQRRGANDLGTWVRRRKGLRFWHYGGAE